MKRLFAGLILVFLLVASPLFVFATANAEAVNESPALDRGTVLPATAFKVEQCMSILNYVESLGYDEKRTLLAKRTSEPINVASLTFNASDVLACGIRTGNMHLWMIPFYIRYILEFVIGLAGLIAVAGIVYGGYLYLFAGVSDDKDKGKKSIMYSVVGMILTLLAWAFVNVFVSFFTG